MHVPACHHNTEDFLRSLLSYIGPAISTPRTPPRAELDLGYAEVEPTTNSCQPLKSELQEGWGEGSCQKTADLCMLCPSQLTLSHTPRLLRNEVG